MRARDVSFESLKALLGKTIDDPAVAALLAASGRVKREKPFGTVQEVRCKDAGFDLYFYRASSDESAPRRVGAIFLYGTNDNEGHRPFAAPPLGITFVPRAQMLRGCPPPTQTWKIGVGVVDVTYAQPTYDIWDVDGTRVRVCYGPGPLVEINRIDVTPLDPA